MTEATLFPPGDVFWLVLGDDIELPGANKVAKDVPRLFRVRLFASRCLLDDH